MSELDGWETGGYRRRLPKRVRDVMSIQQPSESVIEDGRIGELETVHDGGRTVDVSEARITAKPTEERISPLLPGTGYLPPGQPGGPR